MTVLRTTDGRFVLPGNRWDLLAGVQPDRPPTVAVVIAYFNAQEQLDRLFAALGAQRYPLDRVEVIVADDGSARAPRLSGAGELDVTLVRQPDLGFRAGAARNLGARAASSQVLVFLDVDTVPAPDYLRRLVRLPALTPDALVTGRRRHADLSGWTPDRLVQWLHGEGFGPVELTEPRWLIDEHRRTGDLLRLDRFSYRSVISAVLSCSRALFEELGGFEETLTQYGGEDWELAHRALCAGAIVAHEPRAVAWHDGPEWAERGDAESRRREKDLETAALAELIPSIDRMARSWTGRPGIVGEIDIADADDAATIESVRALLATGLDIGLWLRGARADSVRGRYFPTDRQVRVAPIDPAARASARVELNLSRPLLVQPSAWPALLDQVESAGVGEITVAARGAALTVTSVPARARVDRWTPYLPGRDLMAELFGRRSIDGAAAGVMTLAGGPETDGPV